MKPLLFTFLTAFAFTTFAQSVTFTNKKNQKQYEALLPVQAIVHLKGGGKITGYLNSVNDEDVTVRLLSSDKKVKHTFPPREEVKKIRKDKSLTSYEKASKMNKLTMETSYDDSITLKRNLIENIELERKNWGVAVGAGMASTLIAGTALGELFKVNKVTPTQYVLYLNLVELVARPLVHFSIYRPFDTKDIWTYASN